MLSASELEGETGAVLATRRSTADVRAVLMSQDQTKKEPHMLKAIALSFAMIFSAACMDVATVDTSTSAIDTQRTDSTAPSDDAVHTDGVGDELAPDTDNVETIDGSACPVNCLTAVGSPPCCPGQYCRRVSLAYGKCTAI